MMKRYGVIMAGGGGTRFWPLSRQKQPKQLLNLTGRDILINETIDRMSFTIDRKDIFIVTSAIQAPSMIHATDARIRPDHILAEPAARDTAACIGYAAMEIVRKYGDGIMLITPSDHYIRDVATLTRTFAKAIACAETEDKLVTIGITPTFPSTGFGYIKYGENNDEDAKPVLAFHEKPKLEIAEQYIQDGHFAWNSGMFIWRAGLILEKFQEFIPDIYAQLCEIRDAMGTPNEQRVIQKVYPEIRKISVDYAIMEPCAEKGDVRLLPGDFGWNDVGSWDMMDVLHEADDSGNILLGDSVVVEGQGNICYSTGRLISVLGMKDTVVVETEDAVMVCPKERAQDVKLIVEELNNRQRRDLL